MIYGNGSPSNNKGNYPAVELGCNRLLSDPILIFSALQKQGIYRVPGYKAKMNELKMLYDRGKSLLGHLLFF